MGAKRPVTEQCYRAPTWRHDLAVTGVITASALSWIARTDLGASIAQLLIAGTTSIDISASAFTGQLIAQDTRWRLVDRLIHEDEIPAAEAGLLALLFAQEPSRIIALTTDHMDISGGTVTLRLGKAPVQMPPPLDGYLRTLHAEATARDTAADRWLYPGRFPPSTSAPSG